MTDRIEALLAPIELGSLRLRNGVLMAPLTRCRADADGTPTSLMVEHYVQRAQAGLIITEATHVAASSCAFERSPGLFSAAHVAGWKRVTDAVHAAGGTIAVQLWHCGAVGASSLLGGRAPMSPSGVNDALELLQVFGELPDGRYGRLEATPSREMSTDDIEQVIEAYGRAARLARAAGFDGVEVHAANGYLPHQFMSPTLNRRTDAWGGTVERRLHFLEEVLRVVSSAVGSSRVGVRLSPFARYNDVRDPAPADTTLALARLIEPLKLAWVHLADTNAWGGRPDLELMVHLFRAHYSGRLVGNGGLSPEHAEQLIRRGTLDAVAFGRAFVANPDLVRRVHEGLALSEAEPKTFYGGGAEGYTDYACAPAPERRRAA